MQIILVTASIQYRVYQLTSFSCKKFSFQTHFCVIWVLYNLKKSCWKYLRLKFQNHKCSVDQKPEKMLEEGSPSEILWKWWIRIMNLCPVHPQHEWHDNIKKMLKKFLKNFSSAITLYLFFLWMAAMFLIKKHVLVLAVNKVEMLN